MNVCKLSAVGTKLRIEIEERLERFALSIYVTKSCDNVNNTKVGDIEGRQFIHLLPSRYHSVDPCCLLFPAKRDAACTAVVCVVLRVV